MRGATDVAVTGDTVVALRAGRLDLHDLGDGSRRRIDVPGRRLAVVSAAGRYAAYAARHASPRQVTIVIDLVTGREVYRVRTSNYRLGPNGRLWFQRWRNRRSARIVTVAPWQRRPRALGRLRLHPYEFAAARGGLAVLRTLPAGQSEIVLVRTDGERRALTPVVPSIGSIAYDGTTLAFASGDCVFAGPVPAGTPAPLDTSGCDQ
jgi:hypothetical protein